MDESNVANRRRTNNIPAPSNMKYDASMLETEQVMTRRGSRINPKFFVGQDYVLGPRPIFTKPYYIKKTSYGDLK